MPTTPPIIGIPDVSVGFTGFSVLWATVALAILVGSALLLWIMRNGHSPVDGKKAS